MTALQSALAAATDPARRSLAQGWRVFKAAEADAKGNAIYVHALFPAVAGADYRPSLLLDQLLASRPPNCWRNTRKRWPVRRRACRSPSWRTWPWRR